MSIDQKYRKYKQLQRLFPQLKNVTLIPINNEKVGKYHGFTSHTHIQNSKMIEEGKLRYQRVAPSKIEVNLTHQNALYVLIHQIAHCLSPLVWRKNKEEWEYRQHDRIFYQKLWEIIKIANKQEIYCKQFDSLNHLMKYDASV